MSDDDLRFGDIGGSDGDGNDSDIVDTAVQIIVLIIFFYVALILLESLFGIPIPFV